MNVCMYMYVQVQILYRNSMCVWYVGGLVALISQD